MSGAPAAPALEAVVGALFGVCGAETVRCDANAAALAGGAPGAVSTAREPLADVFVLADARLDGAGALAAALGIAPECAPAEMILRAYLAWGVDCAQRLIGDYAFAVWDGRKRTLFCARDHIGARPFLYGRTRDRFVFASRVEGVLACPGIPGDLDEPFVLACLEGGESRRSEHTFFASVRRLPPGHSLVVCGGAERLERFWSVEEAPDVRFRRNSDYVERARELHRTALLDRLHGGGVLGVHLSGGLDCSGLAVAAARELADLGRPPPAAYAWLPPAGDGKPSVEHELVGCVARQVGLSVAHVAPTSDDLTALAARDATRDIVCTGALINEAPVQARAAEAGVRVMLSGWGGDEGLSFNGRGCLPQMLLRGQWRELWSQCNAIGHPGRNLASLSVLPVADAVWPGIANWLTGRRHRSGLRSLVPAEVSRRVSRLPNLRYRETSVRSVRSYLFGCGQLTDRIDEWGASGARLGIEYRYPLLDRRLLDFACGLPPEQFRHGPHRRWIMRTAMEGLLPAEICWNPVKQEPARVDALHRAMAGALPRLARMVRERRSAMTRTEFVDIDRLLEALDPAAYRADPRPGMLLKTLQFLDLA